MKTEPTFRLLHILVIGAAGGIGRKCVEYALEQGHRVTAVMRNPAKLELSHQNLKKVPGDIHDPGSLSIHLINVDVAISAVGVNGGFSWSKPTTLYSTGAKNLLGEAEMAQVPRAFFISASALDISPVIPLYGRLLAKYVVQKLLKHMYADLRIMESIVKDSDLNWTIIRPPRLTDGPLRGNYRIAINEFLKDCLQISRADVAHFIINRVDDPETFKSTIEISY